MLCANCSTKNSFLKGTFLSSIEMDCTTPTYGEYSKNYINFSLLWNVKTISTRRSRIDNGMSY